MAIQDPKPDEIVPSKTQKGKQEGFTILFTEAYAMPSNTYVEDDSHTFTVSLDRSLCWKNFGRCWFDEGERELIAKQTAYKEWLLEFCPPKDYAKCGIMFGVNGVCHTTSNRELLIGEDNVDVRLAPKNFVTVSIFGKYGFGLDILKQLITDSYHRASLQVPMAEDVLQMVLDRIDQTLDDEVLAWRQLMSEYFMLPIEPILQKHPDAVANLRMMITHLLQNRELIYEEFRKRQVVQPTYEKNIYMLLSQSVSHYLDFLVQNGYIDNTMRTNALQAMTLFFNRLFRVVDGQVQAVTQMGGLDQNLVKKLQRTGEI